MLLLYLIFVVLPFLVFAFFVYKQVTIYLKQRKKQIEFFSCLKYDNSIYDIFHDFSNRYEIEKYINYLKWKRGVEANYDMSKIDLLATENGNERDKQVIQYIDDILDKIYNDEEFNEDCDVTDPTESWMRKLNCKEIMRLKIFLLKKVIYFLPICNKIIQDKNIKHRLYKNYYIDDNISKQYDEECEIFMQEFNKIILEANCLANNWGETIMAEAHKISQHNKMKMEEEKKKKEEMKNLLKKQKMKEKKLKELEEKADQIANEMLEEENNKKKKKNK